jgi:hypothetical protein
MTFPARAALAIVAAGLLVGAVAGTVAAAEPSVSLNVTNGECVTGASPPTLVDGRTACGGAIAGAGGFSGRIYGSGTALLSGLVCVHSPSDASFSSYGGAYALSVNSVGQASGGSSRENVVGGQDCTVGAAATSGAPIKVTFPPSGYLGYTLAISGVSPANGSSAFRAYDRMSVRIFVTGAGQPSAASSPAVAPPGPPGDIPESPFVPALLLSAGVLTILMVQRRMRACGELQS